MYKKLVILVLVVSMLFVFAGCGVSSENGEKKSKLDEIKEAGKIVLGTSADYPPYEFHKEIDGKDEIVGFDIEIAKTIAEDLGVELEIVDMKFEGLLGSLVAGDIDFVIAGMENDEERAKSVDFSIQYYQAMHRMIIRKSDAEILKGPEDFKGKKIGFQKATSQEDLANEKFTEAELIGLSKITDLVLELSNNTIDGVLLAEPVAAAYAKQNPNLYMPEVILGSENGISVAVQKGNTELLDSINKTLEKLINEGTIDKFMQEATSLADQ